MSLFTKITLFFYIVVFLANTSLGILVMRKNSKARTNIMFGIYALSLALWNISLFFTITSIGGPTLQLWWSRLAFSFMLLMLNGFLYFAFVYLLKRVRIWAEAVFFIFTAVLFILTLTPLLVVGDIVIIDGFITGTLGPLMGYLTWYYLGAIILSIGILFYKLFKHRGIERVRLIYITIGFGVFAIPSITTNILLPILFENFKYNNLGPLFSFPMLVIIGYAIVKYHLMDIKTLVRRGTVFTILFTFLAVILTFGISLLKLILPFFVAEIAAAFLVVIMFSPLKRFLETITDKIFFQKPYRFEQALSELNRIIIRTYKLDDLVKSIFDHLEDVLKVEHMAMFLVENSKIYTLRSVREKEGIPDSIDSSSSIVRHFSVKVKEAEKYKNDILEIGEITERYEKSSNSLEREELSALKREMESMDFRVAVPIFSKESVTGILFLGEKQSQDPYSVQDIQFLDIVSYEVAFSIENLINIDKILRLDRAKSEFISVISHQLRTPLSIARWGMEMLLDGSYGEVKDETAKKSIYQSYDSIMRMNEGLNNLIMALQITEKGVRLQEREIDFDENIVRSVIKELQPKTKEKNITVTVRYENFDMMQLTCDPMKIAFAFRALIYNAILYSPSGSNVDVVIKKNGNDVTVSVDDSGIGISRENREDIFKKFWRGEEARIVSPDGLGLSLFISRSFIQAHGGMLWIEDKKEKGSRVAFSFRFSKNKKEGIIQL